LAELLPEEYSSMTIVMISSTCLALLSVKSEFFAFSPGQMDPVGGSDIFSSGTGTDSSFFTILTFGEHPATTSRKRTLIKAMLSSRVIEWSSGRVVKWLLLFDFISFTLNLR